MLLTKTQDFHKIVQAGDFALDQNFNEAISIFGYTKVGKTVTGHMICNNPLISAEDIDELFYKVDKDNTFLSAKIGHDSISQTRIPNIFKTNYKDQKGMVHHMAIFDQPGYGDSAGFHRILANGYFHYKSFLKTPKMKFLIAIRRADLDGVAEQFKKTIFLFMNSFINYQQIKSQILKATAILLTKTPSNLKPLAAKQLITKIKNNMQNMSPNQTKLFNEFIDNMIKNDKIFFVSRPKQEGVKTVKNTLLEDINKKTSFWVRKMAKVGEVDMKDINFSAISEVLDKLNATTINHEFNSDFDKCLNEMKQKNKKIINTNSYSLENITQLLKKDAMTSSNSCEYLKGMVKFIQQNYTNFDQKYNTQRQNMEISLLLDDQDLQNPQKHNISAKIDQINDKQRREMYFIKKFQILEFIMKRSQQFLEQPLIRYRTPQSLELINKFIKSIFKKIYYSQIDETHGNFFAKCYYIIWRLIQESKIIVLVLLSDKRYKDEWGQRGVNIHKSIISDLIVDLATNKWANMKLRQMKLLYIANLNLNELTFPINMEVINFFESCQNIDDNLKQKICKQINISPQMIKLKIVQLLIKYYRKNSCSGWKKLSIIGHKMLSYRVYLEKYMNDNPNKQQQDYIQRIIFIISKIIAKILIELDYIPYAIQIYKNINNPEGIFEIYRQKTKHDSNSQVPVKQLLQYASFAAAYSRTELAIQCLQEAFNGSENPSDRKNIGDRIHYLSTQSLSNDSNDYMRRTRTSSSISLVKNKQSQNYATRLNSRLLAEKLPQNLVKQIKKVFENNSS